MCSRDGHCRAFDADAEGTVFGSGIGVVVLKRLSDAFRIGDTFAPSFGRSAISNDGATKVELLGADVRGSGRSHAPQHGRG